MHALTLPSATCPIVLFFTVAPRAQSRFDDKRSTTSGRYTATIREPWLFVPGRLDPTDPASAGMPPEPPRRPGDPADRLLSVRWTT